MSFPYEQLVEAAKQMIDEAGTQCVLVVKEMASDAEEWDEPTIEKRYPFVGAFLTPKEKMIGGSLVAAGELKVLTYSMTPSLTREVALTARIIRKAPTGEDEVWTINEFVDIRPASMSVLYTFKVTR
ncbi:hypothetical protein OMDBNIEC_00080 [Salmonella phage STP-SP5]|nr:hypothetical protein OMDBNIEC_00080 [Salmonella phage STP-SP5]